MFKRIKDAWEADPFLCLIYAGFLAFILAFLLSLVLPLMLTSGVQTWTEFFQAVSELSHE